MTYMYMGEIADEDYGAEPRPATEGRSIALERIDHNSRTLLLAFLVMLIVFGLLFVVEIYWAWSLLIGFIAGALFWYFCTI
ncbi:hypothetical protein [carnivorous sponge associated iridovirus]|jgi:hypothetical protein|nr:hypothetical protein [carnivorous sponge associated iridovirus]